ncbi:MAG: SDR family NAD(P)-dependent oxidoreductase [Lachnospiraceae bacterium]|nr:SDR family NAD(P)-dependent oxidoreductase [Lachnospiraceae bacterium]
MEIAIITGASSGLGVEFLEAIISEYPNLDEYWIIARRKDRLDKLVRKYNTKKIVSVGADLASEESYKEIADRLKQEQPEIKVLINNAGYEKSGMFSEMKNFDIQNMISVNIKGMTMVQRICLPYMKTGSFTIITCSVSSFVPVPNQAVYSASKKYVYYFGKALHEELRKKKIGVLLLCPGNMDTEMNPKGQSRQSDKINGLPFLDMKELTIKALKKAAKGKVVYTPGTFYKFYRVAGKILPSNLMIKIIKIWSW